MVVTFFACLSLRRNFFLAGLLDATWLGGSTVQLSTQGSMHGSSCDELAVRFSVNEAFTLVESSITNVLLATDS